MYFFSSLIARQRRKKVRKKEENTQNSYALRAYFKFGKAESFNARKLALRASNSARHCSVRASNEVTSEHKRFGVAEQKKETAEQSEDVEILRGFSFFTPLSFFLPRKQKERKWQIKFLQINK